LPITVPNEIIVVIYIYIVVTSPSAVAAPAATPCSSHGYANAERKSHSGGIIASWGIVNGWIGINGGAVCHYRVIAGNVDYLGIGLLDYDHLFIFHHLGFYLHLLAGFQVALLLGLRAHALHGIHHVGLLGQNSISKIRRPLDIICKSFDDIRKRGQGLNGGIPILLLHGIRECLVFEILVLRQPLLELDDLQRVCGGSQDLS
jgi:hypothetical protein